MNATIHEIVQALAPTALVECIHDIDELSKGATRLQCEFRDACETALIANVGETEARQMMEAVT